MTSTRPIVLCGPSGVGKSTLLKRLFEEFPNSFGFSVSLDGRSYHFVTRDTFTKLVAAGAFLEHAEFGGNLYGTTAQAVKDVSAQPGETRRAILDIDAQGVKLIKSNHAHLDPVYVFLCPPAYHVLRERLEGRATDHAEAITLRLKMALHELHYARKPHSFDYVVVNDDMDHAYKLLRAIAIDSTDGVTFDKVPPADEDELAAQDAMEAAGETLA